MFIFLVIMIGLIYFSFLLLFSQCISGNGVHLISSWWVINPGGVNLQILQANWVAFTHVSSPTGYIFTTLPVWIPAMHLGTPAAMVSTFEIHIPLHTGPRPCWFNTDHSLQLVWTYGAWIWPHVLPMNLPLSRLPWASEGQTSWLSRRYKTHI